MTKRIMAALLTVLMIVSVLPVQVLAAGTETSAVPTFSVDGHYGAPGQSVTVEINVENNPGIMGTILTLEYDPKLTLTEVSAGDAFSELVFTAPGVLTSPCNFVWDGQETPATEDGTILKLTFAVSEDTKRYDKLNVSISYDDGDIVDENFRPISPKVLSGYVNVIDYKPGDVNRDNTVNTVDITWLRRYRAGGYDVTIFEDAADVNDDDKINTVDISLIRRFRAGGYNVELLPHTPRCKHTSLTAVAAVKATCTEKGHTAYWMCDDCNKLFGDMAAKNEITQEDTVIAATGHTEETIPAVKPTATEVGYTEGKRCSVCGEILVKPQEIAPLTGYMIEYVINNAYLETVGVSNPNKKTYTEEDTANGSIELVDLSADGYKFRGWSLNQSAEDFVKITEIPQGSKKNYKLYAHWEEISYDVTYKLYQTPLGEITDEKYLHFTVSKGLKDLPNPEIYNYVFLGWYTDDGKEVTSIPAGTVGDITLNAYWTSKRNLAKSVPLKNPIICEDTTNNVIYFAYELGTIENVPMSEAVWTIQAVAGLAQKKSETVELSTTETCAKNISTSINTATTDSSTWTLASDWEQVTEVNETWAEENGLTKEEAEELVTSSSNTYLVTSSTGGNESTSTTDGTTTLTYDSKNKTEEKGQNFDVEVGGKYSNSTEVSAEVKANAGIVETSGGVKNTSKFEISGSVGYGNYGNDSVSEHSGTDTTKVDTTVSSSTSTWNNSTSKQNTQAASQSSSVSKILSQVISTEKEYGQSYAYGGSGSEAFGMSNTSSKSVDTSSTVTYSTAKKTITTTEYSTDGKSDGCYRLVLAGTFHVFGIVGYDVATKSYFTYTYSVQDDKTYEFLDYAPDLAFNDCENGVLPFEIPYAVYEYVNSKTVITEGIEYTTNTADKTATITGYTGEDADVIVPSYVTSNGTSYRVTGIKAGAFEGTDVRAVILGDGIDEIPNGTFRNCKKLESVSGYFTKIGDEAFSGCESLTKFNLSSGVVHVGEDAFAGAPKLSVRALNEAKALKYAKEQLPNGSAAERKQYAKTITVDLLNAVASSGAKNIVVDISDTILDGDIVLDVPEMESFELQGGNKTYKNVQIKSEADLTALKEITIVNQDCVPLDLSSDNIKFDAVNIQNNGYVMLLPSSAPHITLIRDNIFKATNGEAVVVKNPVLESVKVDGAVGFMKIYGNVYLCGSITGEQHLTVNDGSIIQLTEDQFSGYVKGVCAVSFDPNGGSTATGSKNVYCGFTYGDLPTPTRTGYTFNGWYTSATGGTQVTAETKVTVAGRHTLYAHWTLNSYTASWSSSTGTSITVKRTSSPLAGASTGTISSGTTVLYYGDVLSVSYGANTGYTLASKGATSITVSRNITASDIYATANVNAYTASWSVSTGTSITVKRTSSPLAGASTGTISSGTTVYYGDVLSVSYGANTGYTLASKGATSITVTRNITENDIYATASVNYYQYSIVYKSVNGTSLGSDTATRAFGTTNTISAPAISGYDTPPAQTIAWDSTSKTITFDYTPTAVAFTSVSGQHYTSPITVHTAVAEYRNRTATSVEMRITWTDQITENYGYNYNSQRITATIGGVSSAEVIVVPWGTWSENIKTQPSKTASTAWVSVPVEAGTTSVSVSVYHRQTNYPGTTLDSSFTKTFTAAIPKY